jgi:predicted phosphodiesterase
MPRYAVISDIHANLEALSAVLGRIEKESVERIACLGDLVGYNTDPNTCIDICRSRGITCVAGNHDRAAAGLIEPDGFSDVARAAILWTQQRLTDQNKRFLANLPLIQNIDSQTLMVHGALHPEPNDQVRITTEPVASRTITAMQFEFPSVRVCFFGHTHLVSCYQYDTMTHPTFPADELKLDSSRLYLVNPGAVGQSRDHDPRAAYLVYDTDAQTIHFRRVDYDYAAVKRKLLRTPGVLPSRGFIQRLAQLIGVR